MRRFLAPAPSGEVSPTAAPSFSVVIRAYQAAGSVAEAVESALAQTVPPAEVVVYDDGSSDGTEAALGPYRDRIVYVWRENAGPAGAFNGGVDTARGEFVVVLDADDVFEPPRIEALGELAAARPDLDIVTTDAVWEVDGGIVGRFNSDANPFEVDDQRSVIFERCFIVAPAVRREAVLAVGGQDRRLHAAADWDCWLRMILKGARAGSVDEPLLRYRLRAESVSDDRLSSFLNRVEMLEHLRATIDLLPEDHARLEQSLTHHRATLAVARACDAARREAPEARRLAFAVALDPAHGRTMRSRAALLGAAPPMLRPWLVERLGFPPRFTRREIRDQA